MPEMPNEAPVKWSVYALMDPATDDVKYIGISSCPEVRLYSHLRNAATKGHHSNPKLISWITGLGKQHMVPVMVILESGYGSGKEVEKKWINRYAGDLLLNYAHHVTGNRARKLSMDFKEEIPSAYGLIRSYTDATDKNGTGRHIRRNQEVEFFELDGSIWFMSIDSRGEAMGFVAFPSDAYDESTNAFDLEGVVNATAQSGTMLRYYSSRKFTPQILEAASRAMAQQSMEYDHYDVSKAATTFTARTKFKRTERERRSKLINEAKAEAIKAPHGAACKADWSGTPCTCFKSRIIQILDKIGGGE